MRMFLPEVTSEYSLYRYLMHDVLDTRLNRILEALCQALEPQSEETKTPSISDLMSEMDVKTVKGKSMC